MKNSKFQEWIDEREKFRIVLWQDLHIRFPKAGFREVINEIGIKKCRRIYKLLQSEKWSYLPFTIGFDLPEDAESEIRSLFADPELFVAANILRCAWIKRYAAFLSEPIYQSMAEKLSDYLRKIGVCFQMSCAEKVAYSGNITVAKGNFKLIEGIVFQNFERCTAEEKYILMCYGALALEEFEQGSVEKMVNVFKAQKSLICNVSLD